MERMTGNVDVHGIKRFQVPDAIIVFKCPKCGAICDLDLVDQIYYPIEKPEGGHSVSWECEQCDIEIERKVTIVSVIATLDVSEQKIV